ncbi:MAG: hypothetical protein IPL71_09975 [Anaerolineales bacterium]|uniref:hypothetical protein n=1 Tax=Candidatus Villigracilis proximus TaxID=3140683 RepID=UPI003136C11F|nr:hypothetical protein [Anaerolineales bacterium]
MDELKYELLTEVLGQMEAELLKLYFQSNEIEVELFQEATSLNVMPVTFGRVEIYVEKKDAKRRVVFLQNTTKK